MNAAREASKRRAYKTYRKALRDGTLVRPAACSECHQPCRAHGHHKNYSKPLDVEWLCPQCHRRRRKKVRHETVGALRFPDGKPPPPPHFGSRIAGERTIYGVDRDSLARPCRVTPGQLAAIEIGRLVPILDVAVRIAKALDVTLDYLVNGERR